MANRIDAQRELLTPILIIFLGECLGTHQVRRNVPRHFNKEKQFAQFASPEPWALQAERAWIAVGTLIARKGANRIDAQREFLTPILIVFL